MTELSWLIVACAFGALAQRCRLPVFVGYLAAGWCLGFLGQSVTPLLEQASMLGVLFLLFTVGMHLNPSTLLRREVWAGGGLHIVISTTIFVITCLSFHLALQQALYLGLLLSLSSTVIAAKDLESRDELGSPHGRVAIGILILQDLVAVALLSFTGNSHFNPWLFAALPLIFVAMPLLRRLAERNESPELSLLYITVLVLGLSAWFHHAGASAELGALIAGALLAGHPKADEVAFRVWSLKELLLVGFFLKVGILGLPNLEALYWASLILLVLPLKAILFFCLLALLGMPRRSAFIAGATLTSYSEFTLVGGLAAHQAGLLSADYLSVLALATALSFVINLPVNRLVLHLYERISGLLEHFEPVSSERRPPPPALPGSIGFMVIGLGRTGTAAFRMLAEARRPVLGIDIDPVIADRCERSGWSTLCADARDPEMWKSLPLEDLESVVIALPNLDSRERVVRTLRTLSETVLISVFALDADEARQLREAGADIVTEILEDAGARLAELATPDSGRSSA